jgi:ribosome biogenesis protein ENP2
LDSITEELEEEAHTAVYDNFQFVTREDLEALGLGHLVGSKFLRAYMHGFFMDSRLYAEAKAVAEPFAYEQYRKV